MQRNAEDIYGLEKLNCSRGCFEIEDHIAEIKSKSQCYRDLGLESQPKITVEDLIQSKKEVKSVIEAYYSCQKGCYADAFLQTYCLLEAIGNN